VTGLAPALPVNTAGAARPRDCPVQLPWHGRRQKEGHVLKNLGCYAAQADGDYGAELRIPNTARHQLQLAPYLLGHQHSAVPERRQLVPDGRHIGVHAHGVLLGLVRHPGRLRAHRDTQRAGKGDRLVERVGQRLPRPVHAAQQRLALPLGQSPPDRPSSHLPTHRRGRLPAAAAYAATARSGLDKSGIPASASSTSILGTSSTNAVTSFPVRRCAATTPWPNSGTSSPQLITITP